ncbi:uncharacterized protein LOC134677267 [Cydia fagiglandana]|uniref:uncharacterized protein LOC134677267 n=1 Tax=Cydia fagiglandana TaxID=1458189 RepID=UPI002FEE3DDF
MESIKTSIAELGASFNARMAEFQGQIEKANPESPTVSSVAAQFSAFRAFILKAIETLQQQVEFLSQQVDNMEMRSRRKILLFHGVAEADNEDSSVRILDLLKVHLKTDLIADKIARSHRMGRPRSNKTRCILVEFRDFSDRNAIWAAKTALKGTGVIISEFLTKSRHDVFMMARERFGVRNCYTREGSVYVLVKDGDRSCVTSRADLDKIQVTQPPTAGPVAGVDGAVGLAVDQQPGEPSKRSRKPANRY